MHAWLSKHISKISIAPVFVLLAFICLTLLTSVTVQQNSSMTKKETQLAQASYNLLTEIQKERGMSAGYISSDGKAFSDALIGQQEAVDKALEILLTAPERESLAFTETSLYSPLAKWKADLQNIRKKIQNLTIDVSEVVKFYSSSTKTLIEINAQFFAKAKTVLGKQKLLLLHRLSALQELSGLERAMLSTIFSSKTVNENQRLLVTENLKEQTNLINDIRLLSTVEFAPEINSFVAMQSSRQVDYFRNQVQNISQKALVSTSEEWFTASTERIGNLNTIINTLFRQINLHAEDEYSNASLILILDGVLFIVSCCFLYAIFSVLRSRQAQSDELKNKLHSIKHDQDLTLTVQKLSSDDLGEVAEMLNQVVVGFKNDLHEFQDNATGIASAAAQAESSSVATNNNIQEQQQRVSETLSSTETLNIGIESDLETIANVSAHTRSSTDVVMKGEKLVLNAVAGIEETANEVKGVGQTIERLNEKVGDILNIVDVIGAVADQTNLLALNAAIEAARAGEQGRGFAVVADEVRALAKRTQDNTQEISKVVEGLTTSSNEAFTAIAKGVAKADAAVTYSKEIQIALKDVSDKMTELRSFSDAVEQSAHQQSFSLKQITEGVRSIDLFGAENAVGAEQVSAASQQLSATSSSMLAKIQKYTT